MPDWLSWVDVGVAATGLLLAWGGAQKGFAGQVAHLLTFLLIGVVLFFGWPSVFGYLGELLDGVEEAYLMWGVIAATFLLGIGLFLLVSKLLAGLLRTQISDGADRGWGFALGLLRGLAIALFALIFFVMVDSSGRICGKLEAKSYVGQLVCHKIVPRVHPNLSRSALEERVRAWKARLLDKKEAGVFE